MADREPVIGLEISGLKCDAPGCGWRDPSVKLEEYPEYVNAACPLCGANVLTLADFKAVVAMLRMADFANRWLWWLPKAGKPTKIIGELDGRGKPKFHTEAPQAASDKSREDQ
jgi:hypothetical protein